MIDCSRTCKSWYVLRAAFILGALSLLASCMVGPDYVRPLVDVGVQFKETPGWKPAQPQLADVPGGAWWQMYDDATLNQLMQELNVANQNIAQAEARFRQAVALTRGRVRPCCRPCLQQPVRRVRGARLPPRAVW
jgi:outer membrane protein TolC